MTDGGDTQEAVRLNYPDRYYGESMVPAWIPGQGWVLVSARWVASGLMLMCGFGCIASQVLLYVFVDRINLSVLGAGVTLLMALPVKWAEERRRNG